MKIFGYEFNFKRPEENDALQTFATPVKDDGAVVVASGGTMGAYIDLDGTVKSEAELVNKYREMEQQPECDSAILDVVNEAIVFNDNEDIVKVDFSDEKLPDPLKQVIEEEFKSIKELLEFNTNGHVIFRRFFVDGRLKFHAIIDKTAPKDGIQQLQYIDPRKLRKIREVTPKTDPKTAAIQGSEAIVKTRKEYYIYNDRGFTQGNQGPAGQVYTPPTGGLRIGKDAIIDVTSGLLDPTNTLVLSHLHKAIKPLNQLRALEDSALIYRIARAPERRVFYIDVGGLPKPKAEQYLRDMMVRYKNKLSYDANTGEIRDQRKQLTMLEDFWLARRDGKGTEIDVLQGGNLTGVLDEVEYFQMRLYKSLNVPYTRFSPEAMFTLGRSAEISRDEIKFSIFVDQLKMRFNELFLKCLEKQLILKEIVTPDEWFKIKAKLKFVYAKNNMFAELKNAEIQMERLNRLVLADQFVGKYFSHEFVCKNILCQTDEEMKLESERIAKEMMSMRFNPSMVLGGPGNQPDPNQPQQQDQDPGQQQDPNQQQDQQDQQQQQTATSPDLIKKQQDQKNKINKKNTAKPKQIKRKK